MQCVEYEVVSIFSLQHLDSETTGDRSGIQISSSSVCRVTLKCWISNSIMNRLKHRVALSSQSVKGGGPGEVVLCIFKL